jgi:hypothetical protein
MKTVVAASTGEPDDLQLLKWQDGRLAATFQHVGHLQQHEQQMMASECSCSRKGLAVDLDLFGGQVVRIASTLSMLAICSTKPQPAAGEDGCKRR